MIHFSPNANPFPHSSLQLAIKIGTNNLFLFFLSEGNVVALNPKASEIQRN